MIAKNQHTQRKLLYIVNIYDERQCVKKFQNLTFKVNVKYHLNFSDFISNKNDSLEAYFC